MHLSPSDLFEPLTNSVVLLSSCITALLSLLFGLAVGSIPPGYLAGRLNGFDIRTRGSGSTGFTNVYRTLGLAWALPVLILDLAKGIVPVALADRLGLIPAIVGVGAILGHVFPPWLGFRGGKGVATTLAVSALLCFRSFALAFAVYVLLLFIFGYVSVSSLVFGVILSPLTAIFYPRNYALLGFSLVAGIIILVRHTGNIRRLLAGTEPRFGLWLKLFRKGANS